MSQPEVDHVAWEVVSANRHYHQELLENLLNLYVHDLSSYFDGIEITRTGRYGYNYAWGEIANTPFIMFEGALPIGFALTTKGSAIDDDPNVWDMGEFFVVRSVRRRGAGSWLAGEIWRLQPGTWDIRIGPKNSPALSFWPKAIETHTGRSALSREETIHGNKQVTYRFATD